MDSCTTCRNLEPLPGLSGGFITGGRGHELESSAPTCQLCSILWEGLQAFCLASLETIHWMVLHQEEDLFRLQYKLPESEKWVGLHYYTKDAHDPLSGIFKPASDLEPNTASEKYLDQMKGWIDYCNEKHDICRSRLNTYLPTRVLDVLRDPDFVFVYEPIDTDKGPYIALSHCWGGAVSSITTTETLNEKKDGISVESLPRTFQDAIFVTRKLQCRYLWIDSLCIIQDSLEDWKNEASRMADVYGNSYVTIAATASADSNGGLFYRHDILDARHTAKRCTEAGQPVIVNVRPTLEHTPYFFSTPYGLDPSRRAPLLERSWCFQEYLLSPRVLSFTQWEILWVCLSKRSCNCGTYNENIREIVSSSDLKARFDSQLLKSSSKELRLLWGNIIEAYLLKDVTYDTDRLPALAGIAQLFYERGLGRYVNGLWETSLLSYLFWGVNWLFVQSHKVIAKRNTDKEVPSWSWISVSGSFDASKAAVEGIEILHISYIPEVSRPLAEVCAKNITIRGLLYQARAWVPSDYITGKLGILDPRRFVQVAETREEDWYVDVTSELTCGAESPMDVYILCGTKGPGLVLRLVEEAESIYRRLGRINRVPPRLNEQKPTVIQLV
ncbi:HET-domain-containing protein [Daldinia decipiens]|uniref:HET-domain-containing protein n=1 Tax=Daldinia decipiens TaxID=326647 RepID=UPI0020C44FAF|nr:HET-domain-containing protein [Daldinia decipiens]KAI1654949.1 HET-domain-containing protein [Daldinia decipiens]